MQRETRVSVFESESPSEIQLVKSRLDAGKIVSFLNDKYMSFTTTPTANTIKLMVNLKDEQKAFEIIDALNRYTILDYFGVNQDVQDRHSHCCNINGKSTYYRIVIRKKAGT